MAENDTSKNWPALEKKFGETMKFVGIQRNKRCWANLLMNAQGPRVVPEAGRMHIMLHVSVAQRETIVTSVHNSVSAIPSMIAVFMTKARKTG